MMSNAARSTSSQLMLLSKVSSPRSMATLRLPCWIEITIIVDCLYVDANIGTFADGARFQRQCYARADIESGTCPYGTDKPPIKATFIATLRCKTVSEQVCHRLADALTLHWPTHKAPALIRKSGHGQQSVVPLVALAPQLPAHRACLSPLAPEGEDNHPGDQVLAPPSVPGFEGAKCSPAERQWYARVGSPLGAVVLCEQVRRLNRFARGRPGTSSRVSGQACHTTSGTVPPR